MGAEVDWSLCVGCGICAGSCAPMGVGPPAMNGRNQLARLRRFIQERHIGNGEVVIVACSHGAGGAGAMRDLDGAPVYAAECAGSVHTSVVEFLVRSGVAGVLIVSCPPRDCWHREGPKWLEQRLYHDREAELKARVDRRRVRLAFAALGELDRVRAELAAYRLDLADLEAAARERDIDLDLSCEVPSRETAAP
jgi:coenzyme F420-reducing hydrogenase delta subunit